MSPEMRKKLDAIKAGQKSDMAFNEALVAENDRLIKELLSAREEIKRLSLMIGSSDNKNPSRVRYGANAANKKEAERSYDEKMRSASD